VHDWRDGAHRQMIAKRKAMMEIMADRMPTAPVN